MAAIASAGCADGPESASEASELNELSIAFVAGASLELRDTPRLTAGARDGFACGERFETDGRIRVTCSRGRENLEAIVDVRADPHAASAVVVHRPEGRARDRRSFFACTSAAAGPDGLPGALKCSAKKPTSSSGGGGLSSPFASTIPGIDIANAHVVGKDGALFRGMAPRSETEYTQLFDAGVSAMLIFKNATGDGTDVSGEIDELGRRGLPRSDVLHVPFKWKELPPFAESCSQVVSALKFLAEKRSEGKTVMFHCTVGEDRTGLLAAVRRLVVEPDLDAARAWDEEMCERGYGSGNPLKPGFVVGELEHGLTPLYRKLSYLAKRGVLEAESPSAEICGSDPSADARFEAEAVPAARLRCGTSTRFALE